MGGDTKIVPVESKTQQETKIPQYLQDAGMAATSKAQEINNKPYEGYNGELVAGLSGNQNKAIEYGQASQNAGLDALGLSKGALGAAGSVAGNSVGAGGSELDSAGALYGLSGLKSIGSMDAGKPTADYGASLARLAGNSATANTNAGAGDFDAARRYTAESTKSINPMLPDYMNPYIRMATDPVADRLVEQAGQTKANLASKSAMSGSFGGSRYGLVEAQNDRDLTSSLKDLYGNAYSNAFTNAQTQAGNALQRYATAAGLATDIGTKSNMGANDSVSRLVQSADAAGRAGTTQSSLATDSVNRLNAGGAGMVSLGNARSANANDSVSRLLSLVTPANQTAGTESDLSNAAIQRLLTTGALDQTQRQNVDNANYQQHLNEINYPMQQLNALIAAAGGVPYGTSSTSNTQGQDVVQTPSMFGQIAGLGIAAAGAFSDRGMKENFSPVDDEEVLARFRRTPVETYDYKPEVRARIGDDGGRKIGPMSQDFGREFLGDPNAKIIPMPEILGGLVSAVRALDRRTAPRKKANVGALPRVA